MNASRLFTLLVVISFSNFIYAQTGNVLWEQWDNKPADFTELAGWTDPDNSLLLSSLDGPSNWADNYGARISGYIKADTTGYFTFYLSSDDQGQFLLSDGLDEDNLSLLCQVPGYSSYKEWTKYEEQKSEPAYLRKNEWYYFEAMLIENSGGDHIEVGWTRPGEEVSTITIIGSAYLSQDPVVDSTATLIKKFEFRDLSYPQFTDIDPGAGTVDIDVPYGTGLTDLTPEITLSYGATVNPGSEVSQDFSNPVVYTVTALKGNTRDYTVTVTELPLQTGSSISNVHLEPLDQDAVVHEGEKTISFWYYEGYDESQTITFDLSLYAAADIASGSSFGLDAVPSTIRVTAQDGSQTVYTVNVSVLKGIQDFRDDFSTNQYVSGWKNTPAYEFSRNAANEELDLQMIPVNWADTRFNFPDTLNLHRYPLIRFRLKTDKIIIKDGLRFRLIDINGHNNTHWKNRDLETYKITTINEFIELSTDFTGNIIYNNEEDELDLGQITAMYFDVNRGNTADGKGSDAFINIDDFQVGAEALPNNKPLIDAVKNPPYIYIGDGQQSLDLTGIDDGNPERDENLNLTVRNSNPAVVTIDQVNYDGSSSEGSIQYSPAGTNGFAEITVVVQDDRGTAFSGDSDTDSTKFIVEIRDPDPSANNIPTFGSPEDPWVYANTGQNVIIIPRVDDGDAGKVQDLSFTPTSQDMDMLVVDSVVYVPGDHLALMYITEKGQAGPVSIDLSCQDEEDIAGGGSNIFSAVFSLEIRNFDNPGVLYYATDVAHWQDMPYGENPGIQEGSKIILPAAQSDNTWDQDFFWGVMKGYLTPEVTGDYIFETTDHEGSFLYLSTDISPSNIPGEANPTAQWEVPSGPIELQAGKTYYFEAYHKEIVYDYNFSILWTGPGIARQVISGEYLTVDLDLELPTKPLNAGITIRGTNDVIIVWDAACDNRGISGYNVYPEGYQVNDEVIGKLKYKVTGLEPEHEYSVAVRAMDRFGNLSIPSDILTFTTYPEDNQPPTKPENLSLVNVTGMAIELAWDPATDGETEVRGYNIYLDGGIEPVNEEIINDTSYNIIGLTQETAYSITVTSVDVAYNESVPGTPLLQSTSKFDPMDNSDGIKKGRAFALLETRSHFPGFALNIGYEQSSLARSNRASHAGFENPAFASASTREKLQALDKDRADNMIYNIETTDIYRGNHSVELQGSNGAWFRNQFKSIVNKKYDYFARFAMKKGDDFDGSVKVKVYGQYVTVLTEQSFTPEEDWKEFVLPFSTDYDGGNGNWRIDFTIQGSGGTFYLDNVEFHNADFYDSTATTSKIKEILEEFSPSGIRWGGIGANYKELAHCTGPDPDVTLSYADFMALANHVNAWGLFSLGVGEGKDWYTEPATSAHFLEYLGGPEGTAWGAVRASEGYDNLLAESPGVVLEYGNEVWGFGSHGCGNFTGMTQYAAWASGVISEHVLTSPYYDEQKIFTSLSGRNPDPPSSYGVNRDVFKGDDGSADWVSISGYMGGNLNYDPDVPTGDSELEYHQDSYRVTRDKLRGIPETMKQMFEQSARRLPMYMYEGNMTKDVYNGRLGQAVSFIDYYTSVCRAGVTIPVLFHLTGGQWRLIEDRIDFKKLPMYNMAGLMNKYCKGSMLSSGFTSSEQLTVGDNPIGLSSVGVHTFTNDTVFTVVLFGRDFENDFVVQLDIPDGIGAGNTAKIFTLSGESFSTKDHTITEETLTGFGDSLIVNVPKYSMVLITFRCDDQELEAGLGDYEYTKVSNITATTESGNHFIDTDKGYLKLIALVEPEDALYKGVSWSLVQNDVNAVINFVERLLASGESDGNGTLIVRATARDGSGVYDDLEVTITNQVSTGIEDRDAMVPSVYPVPAKDRLYLSLPGNRGSDIEIFDMNGRSMLKREIHAEDHQLDISNYKEGIYFIRISHNKELIMLRFVKE